MAGVDTYSFTYVSAACSASKSVYGRSWSKGQSAWHERGQEQDVCQLSGVSESRPLQQCFVAPPRTFHTGAPRLIGTTINTFGHCRLSVSDTTCHRWAEVTQFEQDTIFPVVNDHDLAKMCHPQPMRMTSHEFPSLLKPRLRISGSITREGAVGRASFTGVGRRKSETGAGAAWISACNGATCTTTVVGAAKVTAGVGAKEAAGRTCSTWEELIRQSGVARFPPLSLSPQASLGERSMGASSDVSMICNSESCTWGTSTIWMPHTRSLIQKSHTRSLVLVQRVEQEPTLCKLQELEHHLRPRELVSQWSIRTLVLRIRQELE